MTCNRQTSDSTIVLIDLISLIQRLPAQTVLSFRELFNKTWVIINYICPSDRLHIVYDNYIDGSIKEYERRRQNPVKLLDFYGIDMTSKMSVQMVQTPISRNFKS